MCACILSACHDDEDLPGLPGSETRHTVIFYIAGENSLASFVATDSAEIAQASELLPEDVRVVMFIDDAKSSRICVKAKGSSMQTIKTYEGNVCTTDSASMLNVLTDIVLTYPSKSYGLVFWSHATGWIFEDTGSSTTKHQSPKRRSFGIDNGLRSSLTNAGMVMNIPTLAGVLDQLPHFEYIMFDACFMQCVEVAYELRRACNWMIGSPAEIPGDGAPYESVLPLLCAEPFNAEAVLDTYHAYYDRGPGHSNYLGVELSAVNMAGMDAFAQATREAVGKVWNGGREASVSDVQYYIIDSRWPHFYDIGSLFYHNLSEEDYARWYNELAGVLPYVRLSKQWTTGNWMRRFYSIFDQEHCTALSIYAPTAEHADDWNADYRRLQWYKATGMDQTGW